MFCHKEPPVMLLYNLVHFNKKKNSNLLLSMQLHQKFLSDVFPRIESYHFLHSYSKTESERNPIDYLSLCKMSRILFQCATKYQRLFLFLH